ncbi:hypothetical protein Aph01nite_67160 [Acrocarpospora phusangensis]|uniref:CAAX prenyl protease 2/Lysostaphin resistance protein A-like domain-containing protein n=1 Tax=Acrocarpospora phusangensis TaxID=1070424 RepID=A0A919QGI1_9ACTN|nr:CPBP family intramembrane glutamic endopeptidase [Acrocarpospora phusangensis]GIH28406.1 hypothetical protein Aph01nite_67160 [Acrocarpospora phusangensis]
MFAVVLPALAYAISQGLDLNRISEAPIGAQLAVYSQAFAPMLAGLAAWLAAGRGLLPGIVPYVILALGEQIGWSSFLTPRLSRTRSTDATALIVGLCWASFHVPLMLFVPGAIDAGVPIPYAIACFTVQSVTIAFPLVWLRVRTGSIWPVLVLHATLNAALYFVAGAMTAPTEESPWYVGEGGVLTSFYLLAAVLATRKLWRKPA